MILLYPQQLINNSFFKNDLNKILSAVRQSPSAWEAYSVQEHMVIPEYLQYRSCAVYGPDDFCNRIADKLNLVLYENSLDYVYKLPNKYKKRTIKKMHLKEARSLNVPKHIKSLNPNFIKGTVFNDGTALNQTLSDYIEVLVSDPVQIEYELKYLVVNQKYTDRFTYKTKHRDVYPVFPEADEFVNNFLSNIECANGTILTIGFIKQRGFAIIDTDACWKSNSGIFLSHKFLNAIKSSISSYKPIVEAEGK